MTKLLFAASAAALLTVAGTVPSIAQSSSTGVTGGSLTTPMITCRDLSTMDRETARSVVYYFSGYQTGSGMAMSNQASAAGSASGTSDTSGTASTTDMSSTSGTASTTGASGSSSTTADAGNSGTTAGSDTSSTTADAGTSGSASTDTTGSTSTAGSSDTSAAGASGGASSAIVAQLPGFSSIDVDRIIADCQSSPDRQLSDMMQGASGASTP